MGRDISAHTERLGLPKISVEEKEFEAGSSLRSFRLLNIFPHLSDLSILWTFFSIEGILSHCSHLYGLMRMGA